MIIQSSTASKFTVTIQAEPHAPSDADCFTLSRTMLRLKREDSQVISVYRVGTTSPELNLNLYYSDPSGILEMPLRNIVNRYSPTFVLSVDLIDAGDGSLLDSYTITCHTFNGIAYVDMLAPRQKDVNLWTADHAHWVIMPPNVMLNPTDTGLLTSQGLIVESNFGTYGMTQSLGLTWYSVASGTPTAITPGGSRSNQLTVPKAADTLRVSDGVKMKDYQLDRADWCSNLVVCRWTSRTGAVRQHWFPVVAFINDKDGEVSIVESGNGYDIRKNTYKGVRCRLTGLTPYSVWYYQDMLLASDLHAVVNQTTSNFAVEIASMETAAYAEGGVVETPEGNAFRSFEFTIKLRHYDTF